MNRVLAHTGVRFPIIQAPMGWIARSQLASAVSLAGGLGIIETSSGETANCQREIQTMLDSGLPFGVNLPIRFLKDEAMLRYVCESGIRFVTTSAGSPAKFMAPLKAAGITVYHAVPTLDAALKSVDAGVDGLVVEGSEGGGFKNPEEVSTLVLLQAIREKTDIPMVAAGGIVDGRGMAAAFALGATRWAMIKAVVIPHGRSGVIGGAMLGLGRAMGETVAVYTVLNIVFQVNWHILLGAGGNVASLIILKFGEASPYEIKALMAAGLVLFLLTLIVNAVANFIVKTTGKSGR